MATPIGASDLVKALKAEGLEVVEVGDWRTHNRNHKGPWGPVHGVMVHHTVTKGSANTVRILTDGYSSLPGPLCHLGITKDGRVHVISVGRANHAGGGDDDVLRAVIDERDLPADNEANTDGNRHFYGLECENLGDGKDPWPAAQLDAIERAAAALCRHHGWSAESVIGHLEWQPGKVDPRGFSMDAMRDRIAGRLASRPGGSAPSAPKPAPTPSAGTYTVRKGDTLWGIAEDHDTTIAALVTLNRLEDPDKLAVGQRLKVPAKSSKPAPKPAPKPEPRYEPFPGAGFFHGGRRSPIITAMGRRLVAEGCGRYRQGPGPNWTNADRSSYAAWQRKLGYSGSDADGIPGKTSWDKLRVPRVS